MKKPISNSPFFIPHVRSRRWIYLFLALIILLIIYPYIQESSYSQAPWILIFLNGLVVLAIIYEVSYSLSEFVLALVMGIPILVLYWLPLTPRTEIAQTILHALIFLYAIFMLLSYLLPKKTADAETIYGTISLYILIGIFWANIYKMIDYFVPKALAFSNSDVEKTLDWSDFLYYSFVTLTTLGYGDIVPMAPQARSAAILEAVAGVIFIAVMVSKTVGLYVGSLKKIDVQKG